MIKSVKRCRWSVRRQETFCLETMSFVPVARFLSFCMSVIYSCCLTMYILFPHSCCGAPTIIPANDNKGLLCSISSKTIEMNDRTLSVKHHMLNFYFILYINTSVQMQLNKEWKNLKVRKKDIVLDKDNPHMHTNWVTYPLQSLPQTQRRLHIPLPRSRSSEQTTELRLNSSHVPCIDHCSVIAVQ